MKNTKVPSDAGRGMQHPRRLPVVWLILLLGAAVRLGLALPEHTQMAEPDTIVGGLTALEVLRGDTPVFNVGYRNGSLEAHVVAGLFWIFGVSRASLALGPALFGLATMVVWCLFYRATLDRRTAIWAMWIIALPASGFLFWTSLANTYPATLFLCATILWAATRVAETPVESETPGTRRLARPLVLGLAVGLGWWSSPLTLTCTIPAMAWLCLRDPKILLRGRWLATMAVGALVGAAPWISFNVQYGFPSLRRSMATRPVRGLREFYDAGVHLVTSKLPALLANTDPTVRPAVAESVTWLAVPVLVLHVVAAGAFVRVVWRARHDASRDLPTRDLRTRDLPSIARGVPWLLLMVAAVTVALNLVSSASLRPGPTARYILPLYLVVPGILGVFLRWLEVRRRSAAPMVLVPLLMFHVMGIYLPWTQERIDRRERAVVDDRLVETLESEGVEVVLGDYFAVYPINFNSRLTILGIPLIPRHDHKSLATGLSGEKRFALLAPRNRERSFQRWLRRSKLRGRWIEGGERYLVFAVHDPQPARDFIEEIRASVHVRF